VGAFDVTFRAPQDKSRSEVRNRRPLWESKTFADLRGGLVRRITTIIHRTSLAVLCCALTCPLSAIAADTPSDLGAITTELKRLKADEASERYRIEKDEKVIEELQHQLEQLDAKNHALATTSAQLAATNQELKQQTDQKLQSLQSRIDSGYSATSFDTSMARYLGQHQFTFAGAAAGDFIYDRQNAQNTFSLVFEPLVLYKLNDWILFEAEIEAGLPEGSSAEFELPVATAQIFLNDYLEVNAGIFDQPFGDWYEDQSALWANRFITAPLPYGAEALVPPADIGIQLRGSVQWGDLGQDADYTVWAANGPTYDTSLPQPVVGATLESPTNLGTQSNGRAYGARFRVYPFPIDSKLGRLEFGGSTYDGKWLNSNWLYAWGIDFAYLRDNLQARGEFLSAYRQMPAPSAPDNRQGWYVQVGYFLQGLPSLHLGSAVDDAVRRLEPLVRYSGVNQRAIVTDEIANSPEIGFNGSSSIFTPHAREVALGLDYWIEPSIVWQTEFDLELPRAGGTAYTFDGASTPTSHPIGATANDRAVLAQLAIGF